jgi:glutaredoxin
VATPVQAGQEPQVTVAAANPPGESFIPTPSFDATARAPVASSAAPVPAAPVVRAPAAVVSHGPTAEELQAAFVATPIVMYTAPWCSVCARAHAFLSANGLRCVDRDIEADPAARRELKERTGTTSIPTFEIDGELERPGFNERVIERAVARSVERRLGVKGIAIQR